MDKCQPIYITMNSGEKHYVLVIEDEELKRKGIPERFHTMVSRTLDNSYKSYDSATNALEAVLLPLRAMGIHNMTSWDIGINEFLSNEDLSAM